MHSLAPYWVGVSVRNTSLLAWTEHPRRSSIVTASRAMKIEVAIESDEALDPGGGARKVWIGLKD